MANRAGSQRKSRHRGARALNESQDNTDAVSSQGPEAHAGQPDTENLNRVREILFGNEQRAFETRIRDSEARLSDAVLTLRTDVETRLDALSATVQKLVSDVHTELHAETRARGDQGEALKQALAESQQHLGTLIQSTRSDTEAYTQQVQGLLDAQHQDLQHTTSARFEALEKELAKSLAGVQDDKLGRHLLSTLMEDLSHKLRNGSVAHGAGDDASRTTPGRR